MHPIPPAMTSRLYEATLHLCTLGVAGVLVWRVVELRRGIPTWKRFVNEIIWSAIPLLVLLYLEVRR